MLLPYNIIVARMQIYTRVRRVRTVADQRENNATRAAREIVFEKNAERHVCACTHTRRVIIIIVSPGDCRIEKPSHVRYGFLCRRRRRRLRERTRCGQRSIIRPRVWISSLVRGRPSKRFVKKKKITIFESL